MVIIKNVPSMPLARAACEPWGRVGAHHTGIKVVMMQAWEASQ